MFDAIVPSIANPLPFGKRSFPRRAQNKKGLLPPGGVAAVPC